MGTIKNFIEKIKSARYGKDVRQSIVDALEQTYDDAIANGHTDMEVVKARDKYDNLNSRLEADKTERIELTNKEAENRKNADANLQSQINGLASGSPLAASSMAEMTDTTRIYVNTTDGHWYYYNGTNWVVGGKYQAPEDSNTVNLLVGDVDDLNNSVFTIEKGLSILNPNLQYTVNKFLSSKGSLLDADGYYLTDFIEASPDITYIMLQSDNKNPGKGQSLQSQNYICFYARNKEFISSIGSGNYNFTMPSNSKYFRTAFANETTKNKLLSIVPFIEGQINNYDLSFYGLKKIERYITKSQSLTKVNPLNNKKILVFGDSMVYGHTIPEQSWAKLLADDNNMQLTNLSQNGTTLTYVNSEINGASFSADDSVYKKVMDNINNPVDADYIIVFAGTNDIARSVEIGSPDDDKATSFYGALNRICSRLIQTYPDKHICFITPYARYAGNANYDICKKYVDAIIEVCSKHGGIPVFNNMLDGAIDFNNNYQVQSLTLNDTYHLNAEGHLRAKHKYEEFLKSL